jgi:hypothetical protein
MASSRISTGMRMRVEVEETAEAVPVEGLEVGLVAQVVVEAEAAVALPTTRQRSLYKGSHRLC